MTLNAGCTPGDYYLAHEIPVPEEFVSAVLPNELNETHLPCLVCVCVCLHARVGGCLCMCVWAGGCGCGARARDAS